MSTETLVRNGARVDMLYRSIREGAASLDNVPGLLKQIIEDEMWREHLYEKTGEVFKFNSFKEFVETHPPDGLGATVETLIRLCSDDMVMRDLIDRAIQGKIGGQAKNNNASKTNVDNIHIRFSEERPAGTSVSANLRRLRKYAESNPEVGEPLYQAVLAKEKSSNRAMIEAGLRLEQLTIPKDPEKAARAIRRNFNDDQLEQLIKLLREEDDQE